MSTLSKIYVTAELAVELKNKYFDLLGCFALAWICEILQNFAIDTGCLLVPLKSGKDFSCKAKAVQ